MTNHRHLLTKDIQNTTSNITYPIFYNVLGGIQSLDQKVQINDERINFYDQKIISTTKSPRTNDIFRRGINYSPNIFAKFS